MKTPRKRKHEIIYAVDWEKLGSQIAFYRNQKNLRQQDLAKLVDVNTNTISRVEIGVIPCSLELLLSLCNALSVSPDALLIGNYTFTYSSYFSRFSDLRRELSVQLSERIQDVLSTLTEPNMQAVRSSIAAKQRVRS